MNMSIRDPFEFRDWLDSIRRDFAAAVVANQLSSIDHTERPVQQMGSPPPETRVISDNWEARVTAVREIESKSDSDESSLDQLFVIAAEDTDARVRGFAWWTIGQKVRGKCDGESLIVSAIRALNKRFKWSSECKTTRDNASILLDVLSRLVKYEEHTENRRQFVRDHPELHARLRETVGSELLKELGLDIVLRGMENGRE